MPFAKRKRCRHSNYLDQKTNWPAVSLKVQRRHSRYPALGYSPYKAHVTEVVQKLNQGSRRSPEGVITGKLSLRWIGNGFTLWFKVKLKNKLLRLYGNRVSGAAATTAKYGAAVFMKRRMPGRIRHICQVRMMLAVVQYLIGAWQTGHPAQIKAKEQSGKIHAAKISIRI